MNHQALVGLLDPLLGMTNLLPGQKGPTFSALFGEYDKTYLNIYGTQTSRIEEYAALCEGLVYFDELHGCIDDDGALACMLRNRWEGVVTVDGPWAAAMLAPTKEALELSAEELEYQFCFETYTMHQEQAANKGTPYLPSPWLRRHLRQQKPLHVLLTGIVEQTLRESLRQVYMSTGCQVFATPVPFLFGEIVNRSKTIEDVVSEAFEIRETRVVRDYRRASRRLLGELFEGGNVSGWMRALASARKIGRILCSRFGSGSSASLNLSVSLGGPQVSVGLDDSAVSQRIWEWRNRDLIRGLRFHEKVAREALIHNTVINDLRRVFEIDITPERVDELMTIL